MILTSRTVRTQRLIGIDSALEAQTVRFVGDRRQVVGTKDDRQGSDRARMGGHDGRTDGCRSRQSTRRLTCRDPAGKGRQPPAEVIAEERSSSSPARLALCVVALGGADRLLEREQGEELELAGDVVGTFATAPRADPERLVEAADVTEFLGLAEDVAATVLGLVGRAAVGHRMTEDRSMLGGTPIAAPDPGEADPGRLVHVRSDALTGSAQDPRLQSIDAAWSSGVAEGLGQDPVGIDPGEGVVDRMVQVGAPGERERDHQIEFGRGAGRSWIGSSTVSRTASRPASSKPMTVSFHIDQGLPSISVSKTNGPSSIS